MTHNQRLKRIDKLEKRIESSFMPSYRKVRRILQENRDRVPAASLPIGNEISCPWNDLVLSNETVEGYIL
jgi:hypothetical protein